MMARVFESSVLTFRTPKPPWPLSGLAILLAVGLQERQNFIEI